MDKPSDQQRVLLVGREPGRITVLQGGVPGGSTLAEYVRQTCEQILAVIEADSHLPIEVAGLVRSLRVAYLHAAWAGVDGVLIARFQRVLGAESEGSDGMEAERAGALSVESILETLSSQELAELCHFCLMDAEALLHKGQISEYQSSRLYQLRDAYNEALALEAEERGDTDDEEGDMELFARFKLVLGEVPRKGVRGRPFPRSERVKGAETSRGGSTFIARKQ